MSPLRTPRTAWVLPLVLAATASSVEAQIPVFGVHVAGPVQASIAAGVWLGSRHPRRDDASGMIAMLEPGLRGGRASIGYAHAVSGLGSFITGRASALRTWRVSTGPRTYAGLEMQLLPILAIGPRVSAFVPVDRNPRRMLWMIDIGIGL